MTKSKNGTVTKDIIQLETNTLPVLVIKSAFSLLPVGRYLLPLTTLVVVENSFLPLHQGM